MKTAHCISVLFSLALVLVGFSQDKSYLDIKIIDSLIIDKQIKQAETTLQEQLAYIESNSIPDSLYLYPYYVGKIELLKSNAKKASIKADAFYTSITSKTNDKKTHYKSLLKLADFYDELGNYNKSLELTQVALKIVGALKDATREDIGKVEYNVGATLLSLGKIKDSKAYFQKALKHFESYSKTDKGQLSDGYNAVGATMWMTSKLDSAKYYYDKAVKTIATAKGDPIYNLYLATVIKSNISLLEYTQGNLAEAVDIQNDVILNYEKVINNYKDENTVSKAKRFQARAISNMAVFYSEQGNLNKAYDLLKYSYAKKNLLKEPTDSEVITTLIQIGQVQLSMQNYDEALLNLKKGVGDLVKKNENSYWQAAGLHAMAEVYAAQGNIELAKETYEQSEILFKKSLNNEYDTEFLSFLRNKSLFMAKHGEPQKALEASINTYNYVVENGGDGNFSLLKQLLNLAEINYELKNYEQTLIWTEKANQYLKGQSTTADSKQIEFNKPQLILLKASAEYHLDDTKSDDFLKRLLEDLQQATAILEERKTTVYKSEDITILLSGYHMISDFSKKLTLELYQSTNDPKYLDKIIELHESSIYHRIRARLNLRHNITFKDIPKSVLERETAIKSKLSSSLNDSENIKTFMNTEKNWKDFLDTLKSEYPNYYKMRYATIEEPTDHLQKNIQDGTTIVRYLYIDASLYVCILTKTEKKFIKLDTERLNENISKLNENHFDLKKSSTILNDLYRQLWKPFEKTITTERVVIIPDKQLFNLSFETLTFKKINTFSEMATHSLLSKYMMSYNYSLLLTGKGSQAVGYDDNFVSFVPEFNDQMKADYQISIKDSLNLDIAYLTLLPQPFTRTLSEKSSRLFNGNSFLNEKSTEEIFKNSAKEHKIIHIGTHAESNNISPELSRLVFAKSMDSTNTDDNYLYTYEIYNTNLSSNLAILTACETGKPTYQAGEGMISLAHAFNYAGSESILTSLWKIDEQSSAQIIEHFYGYLKDGLPKDEALREAKLDYLASANGRMLAPQYWAGLVLIGDTHPIDLNTATISIFWWILAVVLLVLVIVFLLKKRHKKRERS
ncbi:MAG: CHAT domain-containing tetratricopeptide repeat protein [Psychroserpens sp.]|uniref:CHAT domain-containing protein n=1 Tax=Psychroserpens sp. TaxID=2020870 RepID=UPI003C940133